MKLSNTKSAKKTTGKKKTASKNKPRAMRAVSVDEVVDIDLSEFDIKKVKAKTTIYLDGDVWDKLHEDAEKAGMKYQPYLNQLLRRFVLSEKTDLEKRLEKLESLIYSSAVR